MNDIEVTEYDETSQHSVCECCGNLGIYIWERNGFFCQDCDSVLLESIKGSNKDKSEGPLAPMVVKKQANSGSAIIGGRKAIGIFGETLNIKVSSNLVSADYYAYERILEVEFLSGSIYEYFNVPEQVYIQLLNASSYGSSFDEYIRTKYENRRVP